MPQPGVGIILQNPAAAPVPTPVAWTTTPSTQGMSAFVGTSPFYPQPPYSTAIDTADCYMQIPNVQTLGVASYLIPPGQGYLAVSASTGGTLQVQQGTVGTWVTLTALAAAAMYPYWSDGVNFRINATTSCTFTLYPVRA